MDRTSEWVRRSSSGGPKVALSARLRGELPLLAVWTGREFHSRYRQSGFDSLWSLIQPIGVVLIYGFLFAIILEVAPGGVPYLAFAFAGIAPWRFIAFATSAGFPSIVSSHATITKVYFPREVIPLSVVLAAVVDLAIATSLLLVVVIVQGVGLSVEVVALLPIDAILIAYVAGFTVLGASIGVFIRDVTLLLPLVQQFLFVASPIMYPASLIPDQLEWLNAVNPVAVIVEATRDVTVEHAWPDWSLLGIHTLVALLVLAGALAYCRAVESRMSDLA